jgi:hypothetical protein
MESQVRFSLLVVAALYMGWGLALALVPEAGHGLISHGPDDPVTTAMFGAALIGMTIMFVIAAYDPEREIVHASASGLVVVGFAAAYLVFIVKAMPLTPITVISLLAGIGICGVLLLTEARIDLRNQEKPRRRVHATRRHHALSQP